MIKYPSVKKSTHFSFGTIPECKQILKDALKEVDPEQSFVWLPFYNEVAEYLSDNKGKGLGLIGHCGLGKSNIICHVIPLIFKRYKRKRIVPVYAKQYRGELQSIYCFDELTKESLVQVNKYEPNQLAFHVAINDVEINKKLLFFTMNSTTKGTEIESKYGTDTYDRVRSNCKIIHFIGKSLR